uniref:HP domain-containing protein n=1 Tax=Arcella intermedia TaxID=1963864 RepID=A0A6B2KXS3_9EUKA
MIQLMKLFDETDTIIDQLQQSEKQLKTIAALKALEAKRKSLPAVPKKVNMMPRPVTKDDSQIPGHAAKELPPVPFKKPLPPVHKKPAPPRSQRPAPPTKTAPTTNPIRARQEIAKASDKLRSEDGPATDVSSRAVAVGGFGLLWSLGVTNERLGIIEKKSKAPESPDEFFFQKGRPRLIQVKGRRKTLIRQVQITALSLNDGDVFILDTGKETLYQWNGKKSNPIVRGKALDVVKNIKDKEYGGARTLKFLDQGKTDEDAKEFWNILGGKPETINVGDSEDISEEIVKNLLGMISLYQIVQGDEGIYVPERITIHPMSKNLLKEDGCYILDCLTESFVWCGKKSAIKVRQQTVNLAKDLKLERTFWTAYISKELPETESVLFRARFVDWSYGPPITVAQMPSSNVASTTINKIDLLELHKKRENLPAEVIIDDGKNVPTVWRIEGFERKLIPEEKLGEFHSGESYIVLYRYEWKNKLAGLIYYWQGRNSTTIDQGTAALITRDLNTELQKKSQLAATKDMRVTQNLEPQHFIKIFKNSLLIHKGKESDAVTPETVRLYEIVGSTSGIKFIEVNCTTRALKSHAHFLVQTQDADFIWRGTNTLNPELLDSSKDISLKKRNREAIIINEGEEPATFWNYFPKGREPYPNLLNPKLFVPRLFHYLSTNVLEEVVIYCQDDLNREDVYILDCYSAVFVWQNKTILSDEKELKTVLELAKEYIEVAPDGRDKKNCVLYYTPGGQGREPLAFTSCFCAWDPVPPYHNSYQNMVNADDILKDYKRTYTYQELVNGNFPKGLDTTQLEEYMKEEEFEVTFGMTKKHFSDLPKWKQQQIKREKKLY